MRGMILAAGRGTRMQSLTINTPKPLLRLHGRYLIEYSINALHAAGIHEIVINVSYHAEQIKQAIGQGERYGVTIHYSDEAEPLETGGGILQALPQLGSEPFVVLSSDVISDYSLQTLPKKLNKLAHLVLVDNPIYHPTGDFGLQDQQVVCDGADKLTFANIGIYHPALFNDYQPGKFRLGDVLKKAAKDQQVTGEYFQGLWHNLGQADDLASAAQDTRLAVLV